MVAWPWLDELVDVNPGEYPDLVELPNCDHDYDGGHMFCQLLHGHPGPPPKPGRGVVGSDSEHAETTSPYKRP